MSFLLHRSGSVGDLGGRPPRSTRPKDYSVDREEVHIEHTGPDGKPTYLSLTMELRTVMLKEIKPGAKGGHSADERFKVQLPAGAENRTQIAAHPEWMLDVGDIRYPIGEGRP